MPFNVRFKGAFPRPFLVEDIKDGATTEHVMKKGEDAESGKAVGFKMATWNYWLLKADGTKEDLDAEAAFPAVPGSTTNVWVERVVAPGAVPAAAGAGGGSAAAAGGSGGAPGDSTTSPTAPVVLEARARFERLLAEAHVRRPDPDVMARLLVTRGTEMLLAKTPDEALSIYNWAKNLPLSPTKGNFLKETGFTLDGPLSSHMDNLFSAFGPDGAAYVLKVVPREGDPEVVAALALADAPADVHLVRCRFCSAQRKNGEIFSGLLMPYFARSLASTEVLLRHDILLSRARDSVAAINYLHSKGFVHMDIKEANIFVDAAGIWWLGDFGSCVAPGSPIRTTTPAYNPRGHAEGLPAEHWYDWQMLAALLLRQLGAKVDGSSTAAALSSAAAEVATDDGPQQEESKALSVLLLHLLDLKSATA